jgi:ubiquinone/menaquinone biosynthesis C-methylase UbiE
MLSGFSDARASASLVAFLLSELMTRRMHMTTATSSHQPFGRTYGGTAPENYERFFVPVIGGPLAADLIADADLRPGERVLDVACGTGVVARLAAERVGASGSVAALDINAGMLAVARSKAPSTEPRIRWYESTAESMPIPDEEFDVVLCQLGLQFVADKRAALREMRRVVVGDGRVLVSVPTPTPFFDVLEKALAQHLPGASAFVRLVFSLNDADQIEELFRDAGFRDVTIRRYAKALRLPPPREFLWQYVQSTSLAGLTAEADEALLGALERDVVDGWQRWVERGGLTYQQGMIVTTARK